MKTEMKNKIEYYLDLPYTVILRRDSEGDWVSRIDELEGCVAHGSTQADALQNLEEAKHLWIEDALEAGDNIPVPSQEPDLPSGKWLQRTPRSLHKKLSDLSKREGVSLNQLVATILAEAVGNRRREVQPSAVAIHATCSGVWMGSERHTRQDWEITQPLWHGRIVDALAPAISAIQDNTAIKVVIPRAGKKEHAFNA
jgi:antitoxin HicB